MVFRISISKTKAYRKPKSIFLLKATVSKKGNVVKKSLFKHGYKTTESTNLKYYRWAFSTRLQAQNAAKRLRKLKFKSKSK